jgi:hypothetical protein
VPALTICVLSNTHNINFDGIPMLVTDIVLLLIMLIGLLCMGFHESGVSAFGRLMWRQVGMSAPLASICHSLICPPFQKGLIWLFLATIAEIPPVVSETHSMDPIPLLIVSQVFMSLNLNGRAFFLSSLYLW